MINIASPFGLLQAMLLARISLRKKTIPSCMMEQKSVKEALGFCNRWLSSLQELFNRAPKNLRVDECGLDFEIQVVKEEAENVSITVKQEPTM